MFCPQFNIIASQLLILYRHDAQIASVLGTHLLSLLYQLKCVSGALSLWHSQYEPGPPHIMTWV